MKRAEGHGVEWQQLVAWSNSGWGAQMRRHPPFLGKRAQVFSVPVESQPPGTPLAEHPVSDAGVPGMAKRGAARGWGGEDNRTTATTWLAACLAEEGTKICRCLGLGREGSRLMGLGAPPRTSAPAGHTACSLTN